MYFTANICTSPHFVQSRSRFLPIPLQGYFKNTYVKLSYKREATLNYAAAAAKSLQSCLTLCDPIDGSPPGSSIPGIFQARTLEWVAISFSKAWKWKGKGKSLSHVRLCNPMNHSTPGLPVDHQLPESTQTHVHWVGDAIQPSHPLLSPSPPALNLSQNQGLFKWVSAVHSKLLKILWDGHTRPPYLPPAKSVCRSRSSN